MELIQTQTAQGSINELFARQLEDFKRRLGA